MLTAFGPFVTDMYLPSLPTMTSFFGTSTSMVQLGLTAKFKRQENSVITSCVGMMTCSVLLFVSLVSGASIVLFEGLLFVLLFMLGLTLTSATTLAMENAREQAGTASALLGAASFLFGSIVSPLVGMGDILVSTGITFVICAAASCLCGWAAIHGHTPHTAAINNGVC